ncbi:type II toxin-antitoxin system RelE/ParE family toxin [Megalodesulfovibrio gigas]|uniref:Putative plasmid maintenance system killer protein n=1 Tax=Megalodesulfovibrio gigas (strain ATCC 19364 / DSM 1382 / NCIMB 9332 / VKM B-1759) TaxID=1121448 RepID=T2G7S3_MEGG1|nr:type II toxin-antitoxin system RelE/ParE family toxin [Megalodesulfovibrio gigas]AGW11947.1 putative plasmid maintenance system killer protein [Megalodesulfovibrio gigas DSM 1382 = ATCC 19364]
MIKSFAHKGLEVFFLTGNTKGIQAKHADRLARILDRLDAAVTVQDMDAPGLALHALKGGLVGHWAVKVSGNWRVTFRVEQGEAHIVNYQDYH